MGSGLPRHVHAGAHDWGQVRITRKWFLDTLSVPACCTEHKASATLLHLQTGDAKGQER